MVYKQADRVQETTTSTGTGAVTLGGAVAGYRTFASVMSTNDICYYCIYVPTTVAWETGVGTLTSGTTLARTTLLESSTGALVSFAAGTKYVMMTWPAKALTPLEPFFLMGA